MNLSSSPLRYPGGKGALTDFIIDVILGNNLEECAYIEPFAGGAGAALNLLFEGIVKELYLNDADVTIFAFWHSILTETEKILKIVRDTPVTIEEWQRQRKVLLNERGDMVSLGFAAFFLNRCNRSGIIYSAGPIGGFNQTGKWKIDVRFNKFKLEKRIEKIALYKDKIKIYNKDAVDFLKMIPYDLSRSAFIYLDPPYFAKGRKLYMNYFKEDDHRKLYDFINEWNNLYWLITYDDAEFIRILYSKYRLFSYHINYSLQEKRKGEELLITPPYIFLPPAVKINGKVITLSRQTAAKGEYHGYNN